MKSTSIGQRLNTTRTVLALMLLAGMLLTLWSERIRSHSELSSERLLKAKDRIYFDMVEMSDSVRGLLTNPDAEPEMKRWNESSRSFMRTVGAIRGSYPNQLELLVAVDQLRDFVSTELMPFYRNTLDHIQTDALGAVAEYQKKYPSLNKTRSLKFAEFNQKVLNTVAMETDQAKAVGAVIGLGTLAAVGFGGLIFFRTQSAAVSEPLKQLVSGIERMRGGDFTGRMDLKREDEFGTLGQGFNRLADDLSAIVGQVQRAGSQVSTNAAQIASTSSEQQVTAAEIASTIAWIGQASKDISSTSRQLVNTVKEVNEVSGETARLAVNGQNAIGRMEDTMRQVIAASGAVTAKLAVMSEKTSNINTMVTTITKVADQTNLLSLNAAIEAEKAGEYGLGFSVVAVEIRRLADQTAVATYDIEKMVKEMHSAMSAAVMGMDKFSEQVRCGVDEIHQVSTQLAQIILQVQTLNPRFQVVNDGVKSQAGGAQQISETLLQLGESAKKTAESLRHSNVAIEQLNDAARNLRDSVARFKLRT